MIEQENQWFEHQAEKWLESRPICSVCGEPIQDESAVLIRDEWICDECLEGFRRFIDWEEKYE